MSPTDQLTAIFSDTYVYFTRNLVCSIDAPCGLESHHKSNGDGCEQQLQLLLAWVFPATAMYEYDTFWTIGMLSSDNAQALCLITLNQSPSVYRGGNFFANSSKVEFALCFSVTPENATSGEDPTYTNRTYHDCESFTISGACYIYRDGSTDNEDLLVSRAVSFRF